MKKVIRKCLISLIGKKEYKSIKDTKFNPIGIFDNDAKELVHNYLIEAYWNIFKDNIDSDNKIIDTTIIKKLGITKHHRKTFSPVSKISTHNI